MQPQVPHPFAAPVHQALGQQIGAFQAGALAPAQSVLSDQGSARLSGPRGDASETDGSQDRASGRNRRRTRVQRPRAQRSHRHSSSEDDDPNDGYAHNRERPEQNCHKVPGVKEFNHGAKQVFAIWVEKFEAGVKKGVNPHSRRRHYRHCLEWLPNYLGPEAYAIWNRSAYKDSDWLALKKELKLEYEDPIIRAEWKCNLRAYTWDESKESLHTYCSKVKQYVDSFETELLDGSKAKLDAYFIRFISGLPKDYQDQVKMSMPTHKQCIKRAYDICLRYQSTRKTRPSLRSETVASVGFEDPSLPARVQQNESNIIRLKNRVGKIEESSLSQGDSSPQRNSSQGRTSDFSSDSSQRSRDRLARFSNWKRGNSRNYNSGGNQNSGSNHNSVGNRNSGSNHNSGSNFNSGGNQSSGGNHNSGGNQNSGGNHNSGGNNNRGRNFGSNRRHTPSPHRSSNQGGTSSLNTSQVSQTDVESGAEDLNDTVARYAAAVEEEERQNFLDFCAMDDDARAAFVPGNF